MSENEAAVQTNAGQTDAGPANAEPTSAGPVPPNSGPSETVRIDSWVWSVRLAKTRSAAAAACRAGHVRVNGEHVKPAQAVRIGDKVRVRQEDWERSVVVAKIVRKRVGAVIAVECYVDHSPPPPTRESALAVGVRDRGAGRPTKRERRDLDNLRGR